MSKRMTLLMTAGILFGGCVMESDDQFWEDVAQEGATSEVKGEEPIKLQEVKTTRLPALSCDGIGEKDYCESMQTAYSVVGASRSMNELFPVVVEQVLGYRSKAKEEPKPFDPLEGWKVLQVEVDELPADWQDLAEVVPGAEVKVASYIREYIGKGYAVRISGQLMVSSNGSNIVVGFRILQSVEIGEEPGCGKKCK